MSHHAGQMSGYRLVGYFPGWGIHAQHYLVTDIPADRLTHVIYAFATINESADCMSVNGYDDATNFPLLRDLKQHHPGLRTLISVGGHSNSTNFPIAASSDTLRRHFAQSCVGFMTQNGFDGIDIDWEFPTADESSGFTALLTALRDALNAQGAADGQSYLLTIAAPAGSSNYRHLQLAKIHPVVDWINLMTYDYSTASSTRTDFVAPLRPYDTTIGNHAALNVDATVQAYLKAGVPSDKLVLGTRFVGTGWRGVAATNNGLYQHADGPAKGTWDNDTKSTGAFGYQDIATNYVGRFAGYRHAEAQVPWLYGADARVMISYEDPQSLQLKAEYVRANALGGAMIWELAADDARHTLLDTLAAALR